MKPYSRSISSCIASLRLYQRTESIFRGPVVSTLIRSNAGDIFTGIMDSSRDNFCIPTNFWEGIVAFKLNVTVASLTCNMIHNGMRKRISNRSKTYLTCAAFILPKTACCVFNKGKGEWHDVLSPVTLHCCPVGIVHK